MRKAINDNPLFQVALIGVLGIVVAFLFITRMSGSSGGGAEETSAPPTDAPVALDPSALSPEAAAEASIDASAAPTVDSAVAAAEGFEPGPGLPKPVVEAYDQGKVVTLLVTRKYGIEDKQLRAMVDRLAAGEAGVRLFRTGVKKVARYSRITEGVDLFRAPALIVVEPKKLTEGAFPLASVRYGYRGEDSIKQTVRDMLYKGETLPYSPRREPQDHNGK